MHLHDLIYGNHVLCIGGSLCEMFAQLVSNLKLIDPSVLVKKVFNHLTGLCMTVYTEYDTRSREPVHSRREIVTDVTLERPEIEFAILADRAEGLNGKLYMMGGGWDQFNVSDFRQPLQFGLAIGLLVPWHQTNEPLPLSVIFEHEDGNQVMPPFQVNVQTGRPPTAKKGQALRSIVAINALMQLPGPGGYRVTASLGPDNVRKVSFWVNQMGAAP